MRDGFARIATTEMANKKKGPDFVQILRDSGEEVLKGF